MGTTAASTSALQPAAVGIDHHEEEAEEEKWRRRQFRIGIQNRMRNQNLTKEGIRGRVRSRSLAMPGKMSRTGKYLGKTKVYNEEGRSLLLLLLRGVFSHIPNE